MSKKYRDRYGDVQIETAAMRDFLRPKFPVNDDGRPVYLTEQCHKIKCDVNAIIRKYDKTGLIEHVARIEGAYGDVSGADFREMQNRLIDIGKKFNELPAGIRKRFDNDPAELLQFMERPENRDEAIKIGLIRGDTSPDLDGLGEFLKSPAPEKPPEQTPKTE